MADPSDKKQPPAARITSYTHGPRGSVTVSDLLKEESKGIQRTMLGESWMGYDLKQGRLSFMPRHLPLPSPVEDEKMLPYWRRPTDEEFRLSYGQELFGPAPDEWTGNNASITIHSLCGYNYTPENYTFQANRLESYGFICLRSRRGEDGQYWELWFLPGLYAAKGDLRKAIKDKSDQLEATLSFLSRNCQFGSMDASFQRMAMIAD